MIGNMPTGQEELASAIRDGHLEENPENKEELRITTSGLARYLILQPAAEAVLAESDEEPSDEPSDEPVPPIAEPESEPAPPPTDPAIEEPPE